MASPELIRLVTPQKASKIIEGLQQGYPPDSVIRNQLQRMLLPILYGHCIAQLFPMDKEEVSGLLLQSYTPQARLERAYLRNLLNSSKDQRVLTLD